MVRSRRSDANGDWRPAARLGLLAGAVSAVAVSLGAGLVGRDAAVDWMVLGSVLLRDRAFQPNPGWLAVGAGVAVHQAANLLWALLLFGVLGRWTRHRRSRALLLLAAPWALLVSAVEYAVLLPRLQPVVVLQQPYWIALATQLIACALYPLFPWIRERVDGRRSARSRFARAWGGLAAGGLCVLAVAAYAGARGHEPPWLGMGDAAADRAFMRAMASYHATGVALAAMAAQKAERAELRSLAHLMIAGRNGEIAILSRWWRSWFGGLMPALSIENRAALPGGPSAADLDRLRQATGATFELMFLPVMIAHHRGVAATSEAALGRLSDPRLRIMAWDIRHSRRGQIAWTQSLDPAWAGRPGTGPGRVDAQPANREWSW